MSRHVPPIEDLNRVRFARIKLLERITQAPTLAAATDACAELLEDPPELIADMYVHELIEKCRGVDAALADRWQDAAGIHAAYAASALPYGKRCGLVAVLRAAN